mmetsp:Transcript_67052/g.174564  ORF Transcript_67052/g.174564 Transcript_67052/m.174564 type:complete len:306 (+) Transcript_67052:344-1261(+)
MWETVQLAFQRRLHEVKVDTAISSRYSFPQRAPILPQRLEITGLATQGQAGPCEAIPPSHVRQALLLDTHAREIAPCVARAATAGLHVVQHCDQGHRLVAAALAHGLDVGCRLKPGRLVQIQGLLGSTDHRRRVLSAEDRPLVVLHRPRVVLVQKVAEDAGTLRLLPDYLRPCRPLGGVGGEAELARAWRNLGQLAIDVAEALQGERAVGYEHKLRVASVAQRRREGGHLHAEESAPRCLHPRHGPRAKLGQGQGRLVCRVVLHCGTVHVDRIEIPIGALKETIPERGPRELRHGQEQECDLGPP